MLWFLDIKLMYLALGKWDECKGNNGVAIPGALESINNPIF